MAQAFFGISPGDCFENTGCAVTALTKSCISRPIWHSWQYATHLGNMAAAILYTHSAVSTEGLVARAYLQARALAS